MDPELEKYIDFVVADGEVTEKEKAILIRKAEELGVDLDEMEMVLNAKLHMAKKEAQPKEVQAEVPPPAKNKPSVAKCPQCAAAIESFSTSCPYCDAEIKNIKTANSVNEFYNKLNELESSREEDETNPLKAIGKTYAKMFSAGGIFGGGKAGQQKRELIKNFPIPNAKEDILEFLALGIPRAKTKGNYFSSNFGDAAWEIKEHNSMVPIWKRKCEQIIIKARFSMKADKKTLEEIETYATELGIK